MMLWTPLNPGRLLHLSCYSTQCMCIHGNTVTHSSSVPESVPLSDSDLLQEELYGSFNKPNPPTLPHHHLPDGSGWGGGVAATYNCRLWMNPNPNMASVHWQPDSSGPQSEFPSEISNFLPDLVLRTDQVRIVGDLKQWPCRWWKWQFQEELYYINGVSWLQNNPQVESYSWSGSTWWCWGRTCVSVLQEPAPVRSSSDNLLISALLRLTLRLKVQQPHWESPWILLPPWQRRSKYRTFRLWSSLTDALVKLRFVFKT